MDEVFGEGGGRGKGSEGEVLVEFWVGRGPLEEEIGVLSGLGRCRSSVRCVCRQISGRLTMNGVSFTRSFSSSRTGKQKLASYGAGAGVDIEGGSESVVR